MKCCGSQCSAMPRVWCRPWLGVGCSGYMTLVSTENLILPFGFLDFCGAPTCFWGEVLLVMLVLVLVSLAPFRLPRRYMFANMGLRSDRCSSAVYGFDTLPKQTQAGNTHMHVYTYAQTRDQQVAPDKSALLVTRLVLYLTRENAVREQQQQQQQQSDNDTTDTTTTTTTNRCYPEQQQRRTAPQ